MRWIPLLALTALVAAGCDDDDDPMEPAVTPVYEVEITNLTTGQPMTPPVGVLHRPSVSLYTVGSAASTEVQEIAENGNLDPMTDLLDGEDDVIDYAVSAGDPPPLLPGETRTFELTGDPDGTVVFSLVAMLICTNDGFTGASGADLPDDVDDDVTYSVNGYDAGTEMNTEDWDDIVPPCGPLTNVDSGGAGTGMSNPLLAEGGVIAAHPGIAGTADLLIDPHDWSDPVARIVITRTE